MLPQIALRNLARNRRRTFLSLLVISVGTAGLFLTGGFIRFSFEGLRDAIIQGGLGHFEVAPALDASATSVDRSGLPPSFEDWQEMRSKIESRPYVRSAGAVIQFAGVATHGDRSAAVLGVAVEPDRERKMDINVRLRRGNNLPEEAPMEGEDRVLLGAGLAKNLGAEPGDRITALISTADGSLNAMDLTVGGTFSTGFQELDSRIMKTHVATAQRLLGTDKVTALVVGLKKTEDTIKAEADLRRVLEGSAQGLAIADWETRAPFYGQVRALYAGIFAFLGTIVAALVALSSSNTLMMSVLERVREFGTLLAVGTSRAQLAGLLLLEALWLGLLGALTGSALGLALVALINFLELEMPPPPAAVDPMKLALSVIPSDFGWVVAFMMGILVLASIPPMFRIFRLKIVEALGHV